ncbi:MAG: aminoacyl-tRNA hydrolase [Atopobiaceae bacterium]|jgi:PTH1 family peptidyl-tRNA hydrolase|nr:aminoacyl-tRNA hydrolase [Atopobiaceae bacterium]MCH4180322.1 aminoacyl-tRNA hydrolase [Atopobiaceae bacterium]MCH4214868.1 aminoacyl-tRNA hydrolase [Atopobiaceae bacterium]MCH4229305.1 aminoacyl-tRNA hydrolase [Atopobiaceae bacterium]MCH4276360.1 aminoacyl-tRNA hydrolase [Atopobiaceae bacterium]
MSHNHAGNGGPRQATPGEVLVVFGLGNPGAEYAGTRHNAGFATIDELARRHGATYWKSEEGADVASTTISGHEVLLAKPQTYMNCSGGPVAKLASAHGIAARNILVVHDDLDIPAGDVRVKFGGGHGGHNGLRSIIDKLTSRDFSRVRCGIGRPPGRMDPADYVLRTLKGSFADDFAAMVTTAADVVESCVNDGVIPTRDKFNTHA